jgi:3-deoxy-manno-octulosonate cytidylyltransferase (CMP-KDO synthetase)
MLLHVLDCAVAANLGECYVACCCRETKDLVEEHGGRAVITDPGIQSGTDRAYAAVVSLGLKPRYVVNLQGDTPVFSPSILSRTLDVLKNNESIEMTTPVIRREGVDSLNAVSVVFDEMESGAPGRAIYFSRSSIPNGTEAVFSHIGMYAYRFEALEKFASFKQTYLEHVERLEQLRCIQNCMNVWAVPVEGVALSVDTMEDLDNVAKFMREQSLSI